MATKREVRKTLRISLASYIAAVCPESTNKEQRLFVSFLIKMIEGWTSYKTTQERKLFLVEMIKACSGLLPECAAGGLTLKRDFVLEERLGQIVILENEEPVGQYKHVHDVVGR